MDAVIRPETADDVEAVRTVYRLAFSRDDEGGLVDALRAGGYSVLALVAEVEGQVVGHVLISELSIVAGESTVQGLRLGPIAVLLKFRGNGIARGLVAEGLRLCAEQGHRIVIAMGLSSFYLRVGFSVELASQLTPPSSTIILLANELVPGALSNLAGQVQLPLPFQAPRALYTVKCLACGARIPGDAVACSICGWSYGQEREEEEQALADLASRPRIRRPSARRSRKLLRGIGRLVSVLAALAVVSVFACLGLGAILWLVDVVVSWLRD